MSKKSNRNRKSKKEKPAVAFNDEGSCSDDLMAEPQSPPICGPLVRLSIEEVIDREAFKAIERLGSRLLRSAMAIPSAEDELDGNEEILEFHYGEIDLDDDNFVHATEESAQQYSLVIHNFAFLIH